MAAYAWPKCFLCGAVGCYRWDRRPAPPRYLCGEHALQMLASLAMAWGLDVEWLKAQRHLLPSPVVPGLEELESREVVERILGAIFAED